MDVELIYMEVWMEPPIVDWSDKQQEECGFVENMNEILHRHGPFLTDAD